MSVLERTASPRGRTDAGGPRSWPDAYLGLLGGFELRLGQRVVSLPMRARRVLVFLALHARPLSRSYVSQSLWLEATEPHADGNLRSALWEISRLGTPLVEVLGGQLALNPLVNVDFHRSGALADRLLGDPQSLGESELDESMLCEDLLPDWYEEWVLPERERYRQLRLHALECLSLQRILVGRFGDAVQASLAAVAGEPLRESANISLIHAYLAEGNAIEAIRQYRSYSSLTRDELGVRPSNRITELVGGLSEK